MAYLIEKFNELKYEFERLKCVHRVPRLYISNYFGELRREVDLYYNRKDLKKQDERLLKSWLDIIRKIEHYENDCQKFFKKLPDQLYERTSDVITHTDMKLNELHSNNIEINLKSNKVEKIIDEMAYLVNDQIIEIETILFNKKKMLFIDISKVNGTKYSDEKETSKLIFINNEYFGRLGTDLIKK
jgi:hypothetical protein